MSRQARSFSFLLRHTFKRRLAAATDVADARGLLRGLHCGPPHGVRVMPDMLAACRENGWNPQRAAAA